MSALAERWYAPCEISYNLGWTPRGRFPSGYESVAHLAADHEPGLGLPALFELPRGSRNQDHLLARARGTVPSELGADPQGPRELRRVRGARGGLRRGAAEAAPRTDPGTRQGVQRHHRGSWKPRHGPGRLPGIQYGRIPHRRALRFEPRKGGDPRPQRIRGLSDERDEEDREEG